MNTSFLDLPFEDIVVIIENMKYNDIIRLCQTSKNFRELCSNEIIQDIMKIKKRERKIVASISLDMDGNVEFDMQMWDPFDESQIIHFIDYWDPASVQNILSELSADRFFYDFTLGDLEVTDEEGILIRLNNLSFSMDRRIFKRLLEEYGRLMMMGSSGTITIYSDESVEVETY